MRYTISPCDSTPPDTVRRGDDVVVGWFISNPRLVLKKKAKENAQKMVRREEDPVARFSGQPRRVGVRLARTRTRDYIATSERMTMSIGVIYAHLISRPASACSSGVLMSGQPGHDTLVTKRRCGLDVRSCEPDLAARDRLSGSPDADASVSVFPSPDCPRWRRRQG